MMGLATQAWWCHRSSSNESRKDVKFRDPWEHTRNLRFSCRARLDCDVVSPRRSTSATFSWRSDDEYYQPAFLSNG